MVCQALWRNDPSMAADYVEKLMLVLESGHVTAPLEGVLQDG